MKDDNLKRGHKDDSFNNLQTIKSTCTVCQAGCGIIVGIEDGRVVSVKGDKANPLNKGNLCQKDCLPSNISTVKIV